METAKFHPAVELILSRMESNPQEFTYEQGKWRHTLEQHLRWMSKEEKDAVNEKLRTINLDNLRTTMLKKIVTEQSQGSNTVTLSGSSQATWTSGITLGSEHLSQEDLHEIKQMLDDYKENGFI